MWEGGGDRKCLRESFCLGLRRGAVEVDVLGTYMLRANFRLILSFFSFTLKKRLAVEEVFFFFYWVFFIIFYMAVLF